MHTRCKAMALSLGLALSLAGCAGKSAQPQYLDDRDPQTQEDTCAYTTFFRPAADPQGQPYVGDPMPYYEDGTYYIYYLKDGGDSFQHSVYLATTTDFVRYTEVEEPILESEAGAQDDWIGTGSVCKVGETYYLFYTGHTGNAKYEFAETILLAKGSDPYHFEKVEGWELTPPAELGQKRDFRDPQAYYDEAADTVTLTVTAAQDGTARLLKFTLPGDLADAADAQYDGIIFTNTQVDCWNLECSDTFFLDGHWYVTYSAQDDTLWYAMADARYGPYGEAKRLDGKLFYAAKHVENGTNAYMVGWGRRSELATYTMDVSAWAGNLVVQQLAARADGSLYLKPVDAVAAQFTEAVPLLSAKDSVTLKAVADPKAESPYRYQTAFEGCERFMLRGEFSYTGEASSTASFGLCFDYSGDSVEYKTISLVPAEQAVQLYFNEESTLITETALDLQPGQTYPFTYIQEGSVGTFYVGDAAALTVRLYGSTGKPIRLFTNGVDATFTALQQFTTP